jgi:GTPase KRas protein
VVTVVVVCHSASSGFPTRKTATTIQTTDKRPFAGKSSITLRLVRSVWTHEYDPTIEDSYSVTRVVDGRNCQLSLTDTAGQEEYRGLWAASNLKSDAFLLVYDITNAESLAQLQYFSELLEIEADGRKERGELPPVVIVAGNKCDLASMRQVKSAEGLDWARRRGCGFMETSAREKVNIEETFARKFGFTLFMDFVLLPYFMG